jgi:anti-anti-sigma factor
MKSQTYVPFPNSQSTFTIDRFRLHEGILLALAGELDLASVSAVDAELRRAEEVHDRIAVDLAEVTFMDASGLAGLIAADQRLRERNGRLVSLVQLLR